MSEVSKVEAASIVLNRNQWLQAFFLGLLLGVNLSGSNIGWLLDVLTRIESQQQQQPIVRNVGSPQPAPPPKPQANVSQESWKDADYWDAVKKAKADSQ